MKRCIQTPRPSDWRTLRQSLSLALATQARLIIGDGARFFEEHHATLPLFGDVQRALRQAGAGELDSRGNDIVYEPASLRSGRHTFASGRYASFVEIALLIMPALFRQPFRSVCTLQGVSHGPDSLPTSFLKETLLPFMERGGLYASCILRRFGFYGSGGGEAELRVYPAEKGSAPLYAEPAGFAIAGARIYISHLSQELALREKGRLAAALDIEPGRVSIIEVIDSDGWGNSVQVTISTDSCSLVIPHEMRLFNEVGDIIFDEETMMAGIDGLAAEAALVVREQRIPEVLALELVPYAALIGETVPGKLMTPAVARAVENAGLFFA